jgi:hypothetical protein
MDNKMNDIQSSKIFLEMINTDISRAIRGDPDGWYGGSVRSW